MSDVGYLLKTWNLPSYSFAGQSSDFRQELYTPILRTMSDGGWLATAVLRLLDSFQVGFLGSNALFFFCTKIF